MNDDIALAIEKLSDACDANSRSVKTVSDSTLRISGCLKDIVTDIVKLEEAVSKLEKRIAELERVK